MTGFVQLCLRSLGRLWILRALFVLRCWRETSVLLQNIAWEKDVCRLLQHFAELRLQKRYLSHAMVPI